MIILDNKNKDILKACQSDFACGNYFYLTKYRYCETCRAKDWC